MHLRGNSRFPRTVPLITLVVDLLRARGGFTYVGTFYYIDRRRWRGPKIGDKAAFTHEERIEENEHVGEGWRALQDVSKVKLKASRSLSLCDACICMTIVRPHTSSIIVRDKHRSRYLEPPVRLC